MTIASFIRSIPDYPKKGIIFRDITTLFKDKKGFALAIDKMAERYKDIKIDKITAIEARGFIIGAALAYKLGIGFIPVRKKGKLPAETIAQEYTLEYGSDTIEIHVDAISAGEKILLVDDLIATGGTALAAASLIESRKAEIIECAFIIDLPDLEGANKLREKGYKVFSLCEFEGE